MPSMSFRRALTRLVLVAAALLLWQAPAFAEGPDGLIYVLTDGNENAVLRLEPAP